jgi:hypothetical protein
VHPGATLVRDGTGLFEVVARSGVHVAGLQADDGRPVRRGKDLLEVLGVDGAVGVCPHRDGRAGA